jgi:hypothetical protein
MKSQLQDESLSENWLRLLALANFAFGLALLLFPVKAAVVLTIAEPVSFLFVQCLGILSLSFGAGYLVASLETSQHWAFIMVGLIFRSLLVLLLLKAYYFNEIGMRGFLLMSAYLIIGIIAFIVILIEAFEVNTREESAPKRFHDLLAFVRTNRGESLAELSEKENVLLIFIRHFGCTFCRETVSEIARLDTSIKGKNLTPVFVHMSDPGFADEFFSRYYDRPVMHISDPSRAIFRSLGLKRGTLMQLFGPKVVLRGFWAGFFKGHGLGAFEGDYLQLGGYFVLSKGQIVFEHKTQGAADIFTPELLPQR